MKGIASHHLHGRKRIRKTKTLEPYPSSKHLVRLLDRVAIVAGILGPVMTLPQIWQIYHFHDAQGVSLISWVAYGFLDMPFVLYGFVHKDRLIQITYILWCTANLAVATGAIIYR
ncbi:MAG TPA: hypothetical protein VMU13_02050 [Candidatus Paceibacterota bacterium]|nr:hypothetical protein [Candidatus Paceibacterota bacterium]